MLQQLMSLARLDFAPEHRQPSAVRVVIASVGSIVGSLLADAAIVAVGQALMPGTKGYVHFRFSDYGKLTVIGVVIACIAWPIVTRVCAAPRWLFFRLAILVTLVLLLPDVYILDKGQPGDAVGVLMVMHLAIGVVTYNLLVRVAPVRSARRSARSPSAGSNVRPPRVAPTQSDV
jgi:O-antigen ligase